MSFQIDGATLPRSIRWRLQRGLLDAPTSTDRSLCEHNFFKVKMQRDRFTNLAEISTSEANKSNNQSPTMDEYVNEHMSDPLTVALKQLEAREQQDQIFQSNLNEHRRQSGVRRVSGVLVIDKSTPKMGSEQIEVILKDVHRLDPEHSQHFHSRVNWQRHEEGFEPIDFEESLKIRNSRLIKVLQTYSSQSGNSYYQGMHEIASYIMFVMEMDLFDMDTNPRPEYDFLIDNDFIVHDTYVTFEDVMLALCKCYEETDVMSNSIVAKIPYVARNKELYNHIQAVPMSHEVYCARWVRLMFSREVKAWRHVLSLWDILFDLTSEDPTILSMDVARYTRPGLTDPLKLGVWELHEVLEMTAASLIWLHRKELLSRQAEDVMELLVCHQPIDSVAPLLATLLSSLHRIQCNEHMAPILLPAQEGRVDQLKHIVDMGITKMAVGIANINLGMSNSKVSKRRKIGRGAKASRLSPEGTSFRRESGLTVHRRTSIQNLADNSADISLLLMESEDEDEAYEVEDDDDFLSCDATSRSYTTHDHDSMDGSFVSIKNLPKRVSLLAMMRSSSKSGDEDAHATELRELGSLAYPDESQSSEEDLEECMDHAPHVDDNMAHCIGLNMAF